MADLPLKLTLEPILPERTPREEPRHKFTYGFSLRIPDGPLVNSDDPLLAALGAEVTGIEVDGSHAEALQSSSVDPGMTLSPVIEAPDEDGDPVIGVWDRERTRCVGNLHWRLAGRVAAAIEQGIEVELLALRELRTAGEDRRVALAVLVAIPAMLRVSVDPELTVLRPKRVALRRLVLFADDRGDVRWWDPTAESGPADVGELPVSRELRRELKKLRKAYAKLEKGMDDGDDSLDPIEANWRRGGLAQQGIRLWCRARRELGREYAVGYLGPGMEVPAWSPGELTPGCSADEDIPF